MSTENTNNDKSASQDNENANVEMFLSRGSWKPMIVPPRNHSVTDTTRRWQLMKNVVRFTSRRSSLTPSEEELLQKIHKSNKRRESIKSSGSVGQPPSIDEEEEQQEPPTELSKSPEDVRVRSKLRLAIDTKSKAEAMTNAEQDFLHSLVNSEDVSTEQLQNIQSVLENDPLYDEDMQSSSSELFVASLKKQELRPKLTQYAGPSFRKEVWTNYESNASIMDGEKKKPPQQDLEESFKPEKKPSFFEKLFSKKPKDSAKEQQQDDSIVLDLAPPKLVLGTHADDENCQPHVLSPPMMDALRPHLPFAIQEDNFWLKYSMIRDGASMRALLQNIRSSARTILAIETMEGDVFGSFTSSPWRPNGHAYYGSGEAFMWRLSQNRYTPCETPLEQIELESQIDVFSWTGQNRNVQALMDADSHLMLGGGGGEEDDKQDQAQRDDSGGVALWIDSTLTRGTSETSLTFNNPRLPTKHDDMFEIANIEVWTLTPVVNLEMAQQLEMGRQFVFDHGNFVEQ